MNEQKLPSGWKLVPVEPTHIMIGAGARAMLSADSATQVDSLALTRVTYPAMLAAAPAPATWSSATAPGPDGYQRTVAVPGMPSAARDAAYDEIAALAVQWGDARTPYCGGNALRNFAEYVLARKSIATPAPVQQAAPGEPTELSKRVRKYAEQSWKFNTANIKPAELIALCDEIERYYGGMLAWKKSAEAIAAAPAQPVGLSEQDKLDAARYRFGCSVDGERAGLGWLSKEEMDEFIDAAILAAKEAP